MRTILSGLSVLLCVLLFTGATGFNAPVIPGRSFYINGRAEVVTELKIVNPDISASDTQDTEHTSNTQGTQNTENTNVTKLKSNISYSIIFLFFIFLIKRIVRKGPKRRKKRNNNEAYCHRNIYLTDDPVTVREDDVDYPSGFGGPGNRKAIYLEDVDAAEDISIIKRKNGDVNGV